MNGQSSVRPWVCLGMQCSAFRHLASLLSLDLLPHPLAHFQTWIISMTHFFHLALESRSPLCHLTCRRSSWAFANIPPACSRFLPFLSTLATDFLYSPPSLEFDFNKKIKKIKNSALIPLSSHIFHWVLSLSLSFDHLSFHHLPVAFLSPLQ